MLLAGISNPWSLGNPRYLALDVRFSISMSTWELGYSWQVRCLLAPRRRARSIITLFCRGHNENMDQNVVSIP